MKVEFSNDAEGVEISIIILIAKYVGLLQECSLVEINAFKKENRFLNHPPHHKPFLTRHTFKSISSGKSTAFFKYTGTGLSTTETLNNTDK